MCVAAAGRIIEIKDGAARADVRGNIIPVELGIVEASVGDYVLIHAGCAIAKVDKSEADELDELMSLVEDYGK